MAAIEEVRIHREYHNYDRSNRFGLKINIKKTEVLYQQKIVDANST